MSRPAQVSGLIKQNDTSTKWIYVLEETPENTHKISLKERFDLKLDGLDRN